MTTMATLSCVWVTSEIQHEVGNWGVQAIWIADDGVGPMGYYDRIHMLKEDGAEVVFPAHMVLGWKLVGDTEESMLVKKELPR